MSERVRLAAILDVMIEVVIEAGQLVLPLFENGCDAKTKADGSIVTLADTRGEALITSRLAAAFPDIGVLGEESDAAGATPDLSGSYFCVDPIDGTKQFASGDPEWVICLGYLEGGRPVAGVILAPALGNRLFAGLADFGGFEQDRDGQRTAFATAKPAPKVLRILRGGHDSEASIKAYLPQGTDISLKGVSSALKFGLIAAGQADLWIRAGRVWDWDIAAGQAIVEAAGGSVTSAAGQALIYGQARENYRHPPFVVRCAALRDFILVKQT
jgi:3'(2'), 5'-bisphosphate nucleotidase